MNNLQQYVNDGNLGAAKAEVEKMLIQEPSAQVWREVLATNSVELAFFVFKKLKATLTINDLSMLMTSLEKDFGTVIHGEDVTGLRRLKNEVSEAIEQLTGVSRTTDTMGNVANIHEFLGKVRKKSDNR